MSWPRSKGRRARPSRRPERQDSCVDGPMTTPEAEVAQRPKPWYESFFGPDYLKQYAHTTTLQEVEGVAKILHLRPGSRVLDLACGAGRHSIELAKRGLEVVGYDLSEPLLKAARAAARKASARVTFVLATCAISPTTGSSTRWSTSSRPSDTSRTPRTTARCSLAWPEPSRRGASSSWSASIANPWRRPCRPNPGRSGTTGV